MKSLRFLDRRAGYSLASLGILLGVVAPAALPAFTSADVLTSRSITMTSATHSATGVGYKVQFTVATALGDGDGFVVQFCDSASGPLVDQDCVEPAGMDLSSATFGSAQIDTGSGLAPAADNGTLTKANETTPGTSNDNYVKWVLGTGDTVGIGKAVQLTVNGITNPSSVGTFYARIYTYTAGNLSGFSNSTTLGTYSDNGSVALSTSDEIGVNAYVLESMTFCVSKGDVGNTGSPYANNPGGTAVAAPRENCGAGISGGCGSYQPGCLISPDITLGQTVGSGTTTALDASTVSTGGVYAQLSTNAANGVSVRLKSGNTVCAGLTLNSIDDTDHCKIPALSTAGITAGTAGFGVTVGSPAAALDKDGNPGTGSATGLGAGTGYGTTAYLSDDSTSGDIGAYGTEIIKSTGVVNNMNVPVTFNATVSNTTPAGVYGAKFSMIATGTF